MNDRSVGCYVSVGKYLITIILEKDGIVANQIRC